MLQKYINQIRKKVNEVPVFSSYSLISAKDLNFTFTGANDWHGRPSIIELSSYWAMGFVEGEQHTTDGTQSVHIVFSTNKGVSWSSKDTFYDGSAVTGFVRKGGTSGSTCTAELQLIYSPNGDIICIAHDRNDSAQWIDTVINRSSDGGKTWLGWQSIGSQFEGGPTLTWAYYDHHIEGNRIYIAMSYAPTRYTDPNWLNNSAKSMLYYSDDYGVNWTKKSDISTLSDITWEPGILRMSNGDWISVCRSNPEKASGADLFLSTDNGDTFIKQTPIYFGAGWHQCILKKFQNESRVYGFGRTQNGSVMENAMYYSDNGLDWNIFRPESNFQSDGGYADGLKRDSNTIYMVGYKGILHETGTLREYIIRGNE